MTSLLHARSCARRVAPRRQPLVAAISQHYRLAFWCASSLLMVGTVNAGTVDGVPDAAMTASSAANVAEAKQLQEVEVRGVAASAISQAPTQSELDAIQPQSIIGLDYINNYVAPTADYASIANIAPAVSNISPAGPGLGESKQMTLRGFSDNQYNVSYDGIPFGDTNDFSHHTSSYFPAKMIGEVSVDRGPGSAGTLGAATFGGTVALRSKDARDTFSFIPTFSAGSYGTTLTHLELNTGRIDELGGGKLIASVQYNNTDTANTHSPMRRTTGYLKYVQPVGEHTEITLLSNYNTIHFNKPNKGSLTQQQIDTLGRNFGLDTDRSSIDCDCYNYQDKNTDMEYLGVHSDLSDTWQLDNKLYTYAYTNGSHESAYVGTKSSKTAMGGYYKVNNYRAWGDTFELAHTDEQGQLRLGGWYEYTGNDRSSVALDYSRGGTIDVKPGDSHSYAPYKYTMNDRLRTTQLYAEYAWQASAALTITPGVKNVGFTRYIDTPYNQGTKLPLKYDQTWRKTLGYLSANYRLGDDWSIYGQAAQGFLAPNLNQFYVPDPRLNRARPQQTMNYQFGTVYKTDRFNAAADAFFIDYRHYPLTAVDPVTHDDIYATAKGARMHGVEAEATYYVGSGVSLYANGSLLDARFKRSHLDLPNIPDSTAALGVNYVRDGFFAGLSGKYIGAQKVYNGDFNPDDAASVTATSNSGGFWRAALSLGYGQKLTGSFIKSYKVKLQVDNLLDASQQVADSVKKGDTYYLVLPGRSWFASVSLAL
ncbi:iron complex outermembrane receptor protein [Rhodanobacter sp. TND4EL1]